MDNYIWVFQKKDDRNLVWAFACSLALHFIFLTILVIKPFYPIAGSTEKLDGIWLYPSLTVQGDLMPNVNASPGIAGPEHVEREKVSEKETVVQSKEEKRTIVATNNEQKQEDNIVQEEPRPDTNIQAEQVTELVTAKVIKKTVEKAAEKEIVVKKPVYTKPTEKLMDDNSGVSINQRKTPLDAANAEKDIEKNAESAKHENAAKDGTAENLFSRTDQEKVVTASGKVDLKSPGTARPIQNAPSSAGRSMTQSSRESINAGKGQTLSRNSTGMEFSKKSGDKLDNNVTSGKKVAGNPLLPIRMAAESPSRPAGMGDSGKSSYQAKLKPGSEPSQIRGTGQPEGKESRDKPTPVAALPKPKIEENARDPVNQQKKGDSSGDNGMALLPLTGDLKLEVTGNTGLVIDVSFKEYLKSRRDRPMTRAEARRVQIVKPVTRTVGKVVEAVVGTTGEGVYEFIVRPVDGNPVTAVFKVKIYENRSKAKTRSLWTKTVKKRTMIARILMPEGIFWDDDGYFSGNLEDSDSITKYNSDTGLVWKEYKSPGD